MWLKYLFSLVLFLLLAQFCSHFKRLSGLPFAGFQRIGSRPTQSISRKVCLSVWCSLRPQQEPHGLETSDQNKKPFFTESGHWADSVLKSLCPPVVCVCLCACECVPSRKPCFPVDSRLLVEECIANTGIPLDVFGLLPFQWFFMFWN